MTLSSATGLLRVPLRCRRIASLALAAVTLSATFAFGLDPAKALTEYTLTNWTEDAGPFPFGVYAIAQDRDGYLWLGARTGLIRFDGTSFVFWKGSDSLPDDRISTICIASDGSLWLGYGTLGGVTRIRQRQVTNFTAQDGLTGGDVNALLEDDGTIWAGTYGGLFRFISDRWHPVSAADGLPREAVLSLFKDRAKNLWVGTSVGVYRRGPDSGTFEFAAAPSSVVSFAQDASGTIWITDRDKGFASLDTASHSAKASPGWEGTLGWALLYDRSRTLWIGSRGNGLLRVRGVGTGDTHATTERLTRREGLPSNEIRVLFEDRDGTLWIGTRMGLSRLTESNIRPAFVGEDAFVSSVTRTRDGSVWIGTSEGLRRRTRDRERRYGTEDGLPGQIVTSLHVDGAGTLWVATTKGVAYFANGKFAELALPRDVRLENVLSMTTDRSGTLWLCDQVKGLTRWKDGRLIRMAEEGRAYFAYADTTDRVWIGLWSSGVAVYQGDHIKRFSVDDGLPAGSVNIVHEDQSGAIWVGTSKGLRRFENGRFVAYAVNGFPESAVVSISDDEHGYVWFGLASGLLRIARSEFDRVAQEPAARLRYKVYGQEDGLPGTLGRPGMPSSTRDTDGRLWFVTSVGLALVDPNRLATVPAPGPVRVEELIADGRRLEPQSHLRLGPRTSRIQIDYSILSLAAATKLRFRYKLDDFDSDWQDAGERRQASYTNLPPGSYRFRVVSTNNDGGWNESGGAFDFSIEPAFYQTRMFYATAAALAALALWSTWQLRWRRAQRQFDLVLAERMRMGREIHDTLLQSLVGVALEFDDIWAQLDPSANALKTQVQRIREQVEHYIREARHSIWNLRSPTLESNDLATALKQSGESAIAGSHSRFEFALHGAPHRVAPGVEEQMLRIGQEALSNAVRHGEAETIRVELFYDPDDVRLRVSDNGRGFDPEHVAGAAESHWGLTSMRERAEQIRASFLLTSSRGAGTVVEIVAPISSEQTE